MKTPMTRRALRAAVPARLKAAIQRWKDQPDGPLAPELYAAGFEKLPNHHLGIEREVLIGRRVVLKTTGWRDVSPASPRYRCARTLAPCILVVPGVIAQPRGICLGRKWDEDTMPERVHAKWKRAAAIIAHCYYVNDDHIWNFALFPDGTVRSIDY